MGIMKIIFLNENEPIRDDAPLFKFYWKYRTLVINKKWFRKSKKEKPEKSLLRCPSCGSTNWYEGPGGGSLGNISCVSCKREYNNLGPFGLQEIKRN